MTAISESIATSESCIFTHNLDTNQIYCQIKTDRLIIESLDKNKHLEDYQRIFFNQANFEKYGDGKAWNLEKTAQKVDAWHTKWRAGNPFSALVITKKKESQVIGHLIIGSSSTPGISELAYMINKPFQSKRYGTEAVKAVMERFIPQLLQYNVAGAPFKGIEATARPDHPASWKILERMGFLHVATIDKYGAERKLYRYSARNTKYFSANLVAAVAAVLFSACAIGYFIERATRI